MGSRLPLQTMSVEEKLQEMEAIWGSLQPSEYDSPEWHEEVLIRREAAEQSGASEFMDWQQAKHEIRKAVE